MTKSRSNFEFRQQASLSQQLAANDEIYQKLAGSDPETSMSIGFFLKLGELGYIDLKEPSWVLMMGLLDVKRKALFATSEKTNEISKMGMQMPRSEAVYDGEHDE